MGIIINDVFEDSCGFTTNQTYASFATNNIHIQKQCKEYYVDIALKDVSGNPNATSYNKEIVDASGNKTITSTGDILTEVLFRERKTKDVYNISAQLSQYKDKQSRLDGKSSINSYRARINIELTELANIFSKLYEEVKTNKVSFPFNNLIDDL